MKIGVLSLGDCLDDPVSGAVTSPAERHRAIVDEGVLAETLGFDSVWLGEHHFCDYVLAAPPVVLAAIAARTTRIRLGTGVTLLANLDPVRVAEDYATVDAISNGRVELSVGRGILVDTYEVFGQKPDQSRERFRENLELLRRLWSERDVTWSGRFRAPLDHVTVEPRPVQRPHPPIWVGGEGRHRTLPIVGRYADVWHGWAAHATQLTEINGIIDRAAEEAGRDPSSIMRASSLSISEPWDQVKAASEWMTAGGIGYLVIDWPSEGQGRLEEFLEQVLPTL